MRRDILQLRDFYTTPLGQAAREMVGRKLQEAWGAAKDLDILGIGYPTPFLDDFPQARRTLAVMPAAQGVEVWPAHAPVRACLAHEAGLPLRNALFDRILVVHALEEADDPRGLMREVWRVLAPTGKVIVAVAARNGLWSHAEKTPFGHGRPYTRQQLESLLREADLEPSGWTRALYCPPMPMVAPWAEGFEQAGAWLWPGFSGLILMEAVKQVFAVKPRGLRSPARVFAPGVFSPSPAGPSPAGNTQSGAIYEPPPSKAAQIGLSSLQNNGVRL